MTDATNHDIAAIAEDFVAAVRRHVGDGDLEKIRQMNATGDYDGGPDATHDFCDAHGLMMETIERHGVASADAALDEDQFYILEKVWNHCFNTGLLRAKREADA